MASSKTPVIEALFDSWWDPATRTLTNLRVSLHDVVAAIVAHNTAKPGQKLSTANPANFMKDFVRSAKSANANWPASVFARGYTAVQKTGGGDCFVFVPLKPGQTVPFPAIAPPEGELDHPIESVSMPLASRLLGREDESWLLQVIVRLRIVETHLSLHSATKPIQVDHLQMNVKGSGSEIDALFLITQGAGSVPTGTTIVCFEAKGLRDDILESQLIGQVQEAFKVVALSYNSVVPMAAKAIGPSRIFVVEFAPVTRAAAATLTALAVHSQRIYRLVPAVPGIGT